MTIPFPDRRPVVGPPPRPPRPVELQRPMHIAHLIMSILTAGFWLLIWGMAAMNASAANDQERKRFAREQAEYEAVYARWWHDYHLAYGHPPPVGF